MSQTSVFALTMLFAGIGIPIQVALNSALGTRMGSPVAAAVILFAVALLILLSVSLLGNPRAIMGVSVAPKHLLFGGVFVAFYVLSITWIAPAFGVGNAVFFVLLGQLVSAAAIDHFGLFGAQVNALSWTRASGIALMAAGVFVTQQV